MSRAIAPVIEQIVNLRQEMHQEIGSLRKEMHQELSGIRQEFGTRLAAVETALGMRQERRNQIRSRLLDYGFKMGWIVLSSMISAAISLTYVTAYLHGLAR